MIKTANNNKTKQFHKTFIAWRMFFLAVILTVMVFPDTSLLAQTAKLHDGTVLTLRTPVQPFATEGPMWDIDPVERTITVTGKVLTFPLTLNGAPLEISGSSALGNDGEAATGIGAANFHRLLDINATGQDVRADRQGAVRSIFSSTEVTRTDSKKPVSRNLVAAAKMEENYFKYLEQAYLAQKAHLPADFLARAGLRSTGNVYPATAGATLKSAGHVYVDTNGKEYYITDIESVIELSENVASGMITNIDAGDPATGRPPSFVIGDMLLIFNQDPRFGAEIFGIAEMHIPIDIFAANGIGQTVDTIGHTVGEHVLFVQELITELFDPSQGTIVATDRWQFDDVANQIRFRGIVSDAKFGTPDELTLEVEMDDGTGPKTFPGFLLLPAGDIGVGIGAGARPGAVFDFRSRDEVAVATVKAVTVRLRYLHASANHPAGEIVVEESILRLAVEEPDE